MLRFSVALIWRWFNPCLGLLQGRGFNAAAELVTASLLNTHLRDNLNYLHDNMKPISIQRGTIAFGTGDVSKTGTITAVNSTANAELFHLGATTAGSGGANAVQTALIYLALTNTTTVTGTRQTNADDGGTNRAATVAFQVTEWPA